MPMDIYSFNFQPSYTKTTTRAMPPPPPPPPPPPGRVPSQSSNGKPPGPKAISNNTTPDDTVASLVQAYQRKTSLSPTVSEFLKDPGLFRLLYEVFEHHLAVIKSRPFPVHDGQVTVYDRALLMLTRRGDGEMYNFGALQLFLDEVMGMRGVKGVDLERVIMKNVAIKGLLVKITRSMSEEASIPEPSDESPTATPRSRNNTTTRHSPRTEDGTNSTNTNDHQTVKDCLARSLVTFSSAQREYNSVTDTDVVAKSRAAKFLRDTAENTLNYLRARNMDHYMVPELEAAFQMAKEKAIALSGGRKRPFEIHEAASGGGGGGGRGGKALSFGRSPGRYRGRGSPKEKTYRAQRHRGDCYRPY
ncbi:hypothetical protein FQN55_004301 [Onygenales sp. PD_40]|nr:hypothetical protein FQN55_004301 [Onygenales sp. PD_40]KAK2789815.1 hypothetical protein FQN51_002647 [Onygenales sp. PD_10]